MNFKRLVIYIAVFYSTFVYSNMQGEFLSNDNTTIANWQMESLDYISETGQPIVADFDQGTNWFWRRGANLNLGGLNDWNSENAPQLVDAEGIDPFDKALLFDGINDWAVCDGHWLGSYLGYDSFEAQFWFKPLSFPSSGYTVLAGTQKWEIWLTNNSVRFVTETGTGGMHTGERYFLIASTGSVKLGEWHHITARYHNGTQTLTVSNESSPSPQTWSASDIPTMGMVNSVINVGARNIESYPFHGLIAAMRISVPGMPGVDDYWQQPRIDGFDTIALLHFDEILEDSEQQTLFTPDDSSNNHRRRTFDGKLLDFGQTSPLVESFAPEFGNSIKFTGGNERILLTHRNTLGYAAREDFRVEAWVKMDESVTPNAQIEYPIISQRWSYRLIYRYRDEQWMAEAIFGYIDNNGTAHGVTLMAPVEPKIWNHVSLQFHKGIMSLYINGELVDRTFREGISSVRPSSQYLSVGWQNTASHRFIGKIDEVYFVSTASYDLQCGNVNGYLAGDINRDCFVGISDLKLLASDWLKVIEPQDWQEFDTDLNYDGKVDILDFAILSDDWLRGHLIMFNGAESLLPAYLNNDTAVIVFDVHTTEDLILVASFEEKDSGIVPTEPITIEIPPYRGLYHHHIDISSWQDGQYIATITGANTEPLIRGIRKQTIAPPPPPNEPIWVNGQKMLFVDDYYWQSSENIEFKTNSAEMIPIEPWKQFPELKRYRNSLTGFNFNIDGSVNVNITGRQTLNDPDPVQYSAVSSDFVNWDVTVNTSSTLSIEDAISINSGDNYRFYEPSIDGTPNLTQVDVVYTGLSAPVWGDIEMPARSMFAVWRKNNGENVILQEQPITQDKLNWADDEIGDWRDTNDNFGRARLYENNSILRFYQTRRIPRHEPFRIHYDNIWASRIMVTWSSTDGIEWTPTYFSVPTEEDPMGYQHYGVDIFSEGLGLELGYLRMYDQYLQQVFTELVYSRNGLLWHRFDDGVFLDNSSEVGDWNFGYSMTTGNRTRRERQGYYYEPMQGINVLHFMFIQVNNLPDRDIVTVDRLHNWGGGRLTGKNGIETTPIWDWYDQSWDNIIEETKGQMFIPGLMKYRRDGWVGVAPEDTNQQGLFTTKILNSTTSLAINAATEQDGFVKIEVLNSNNEPLAAYSGENAAVFTGDSTRSNLSWSGGSLTRPPTFAYRLRVTLYKADLYALYW